MASILRLLSVTLIFLSFFNAVISVQEHELESMLSVLRARGYTLFSNAIATSDLNYDVISGDSFTFFAPTDPSLFTLDMSDTASDYTNALRCHVIPRRLSISELRRFPSGSFFSTLMRGRQIRVERRRRSLGADVITVDGVDVVLPGLFYGRDIAVHGLGGILNFTSGGQLTSPPPPPVANFSGQNSPPQLPPVVPRRRHPLPSPVNFTTPPANLSANHSVGSPIASQSQLPLPPPQGNFSDRPPLVNSSANHSIGSPLASHIHAPPPAANFSYLIPPGNLSANHSIASPAINQTHAAPPPANISDLLEPPSYKDIDNRTIESLVPEPAFADGCSPAYPPEKDHFQPKISPAHDLWHRIPISPPLTPRTAPPASEFPKHNYPMAFPPSIGGLYDGEGQKVLKSEFHDDFSAISPEDLAGIMEIVPEYLGPLNQRIFDCWLTNELFHVSLPHGYLYTRQQTPTSTSSMSCAGI